jgi:hypothetical protein
MNLKNTILNIFDEELKNNFSNEIAISLLKSLNTLVKN